MILVFSDRIRCVLKCKFFNEQTNRLELPALACYAWYFEIWTSIPSLTDQKLSYSREMFSEIDYNLYFFNANATYTLTENASGTLTRDVFFLFLFVFFFLLSMAFGDKIETWKQYTVSTYPPLSGMWLNEAKSGWLSLLGLFTWNKEAIVRDMA